MKVFSVGKTLSVIFQDGTKILDNDCPSETVKYLQEAVLNDIPEETVKLYLNKSYALALEEVEKVENLLDTNISDIMYTKDNCVYLKKVPNVALPQYLIEKLKFVEASKNVVAINTLTNFWVLLCQNPNAQTRINLLQYIERKGFELFESGMFRGFRAVRKIEGSNYDIQQVSAIAKNVKTVQKRPLAMYNIYEDIDGNYIKVLKTVKNLVEVTKNVTFVGQLDELLNGYIEPKYVTNYDKNMEVHLGSILEIPRKNCDEDNSVECSKGLHASHSNWGSYMSFGDVIVDVIVNPKDVVAVPTRSDYDKFRSCRYFVNNIVENTNKLESHSEINEKIAEFFDLTYSDEFNEDKANHFTFEIPKLPEVSNFEDYRVIESSLEEIKQQLKNRY